MPDKWSEGTEVLIDGAVYARSCEDGPLSFHWYQITPTDNEWKLRQVWNPPIRVERISPVDNETNWRARNGVFERHK